MPIIESIVSQHAEEAAFLWLLRDIAVSAPHYSLADLATLDRRVEAHLDGLRVAGNEAWPFCAEGLEQRAAPEVFAGATIALESARRDWIDQVCGAVEAQPDSARGLVSALGWVERRHLQGIVAEFLSSESSLWRRIGIAACAAHRVDCGSHLGKAIGDPAPALRARALRAVGETARRDLLPLVRERLEDPEPECRFAASWSAVRLGDRERAAAVLESVAMSDSPYALTALDLRLRTLTPPAAQRWLSDLAGLPARQRDLVRATGVVGDPVYIPWLLKRMATVPDLARVAGESFASMTGIDIAKLGLDDEPPAELSAGPTEDADDDRVEMDPDRDLAWPHPERMRQWWEANRDRFACGQRYLRGELLEPAHCRRVLREGTQRERKAAALELALWHPETTLFESRAPGFRQQAWLRGA